MLPPSRALPTSRRRGVPLRFGVSSGFARPTPPLGLEGAAPAGWDHWCATRRVGCSHTRLWARPWCSNVVGQRPRPPHRPQESLRERSGNPGEQSPTLTNRWPFARIHPARPGPSAGAPTHPGVARSGCWHSNRRRWRPAAGRPAQSSGPDNSHSSPTTWQGAAPRTGRCPNPPPPASPFAKHARAWPLPLRRPALPPGSRRWKSPALCSHAPERPGGPKSGEDAGWYWLRCPTCGRQRSHAHRRPRYARQTCCRAWSKTRGCLQKIQKCKRGCRRNWCCPGCNLAGFAAALAPCRRSGAPPRDVGPTLCGPGCPRSPACSLPGTTTCRSLQEAAGVLGDRRAASLWATPTRPSWQQRRLPPLAAVDALPGAGESALVPLLDALDGLGDSCARADCDRVGNGDVDVLVLPRRPDLPDKERDLGDNSSCRAVLPCGARNSVADPDCVPLLQSAIEVDVVDEWGEAGNWGQVGSACIAL